MSRWLALTLKFEEDEKIQYYAKEFYEGRIHYTDEYLGGTIYEHMYYGPSPYLYAIYDEYLRSKGKEMPSYIALLRSFFMPGWLIHEKIPSENGLSLVDCTEDDAKKYLGIYRTEEDRERSRQRRDEIAKRILGPRLRGNNNDWTI